MNELLEGLAVATVAQSMAIVMVLLLRPALRRHAGAEAACALWWLPPVAVFAALLPAGGGRVQAVALAAMPAAATQLLQAPAGAVAHGPAAPWLALWLAGVAVMLWMRARQQRRFRRALIAHRRAGWYEGTAGPCVAGFWRPLIVLPPQFRRLYDARERRLIVAHEIAHWRRGDLAANALAALLRCVFWFNPLLHFAAARFRLDQELACDARVMRRFPEARRRYAGAMLKSQLDAAVPMDGIGASGWGWRSDHPLKERISMLNHIHKNAFARHGGRLLVGVLAASMALVTWAARPATPVTSAGFVDAAITLRSAGATQNARMIDAFGRPFLLTTDVGKHAWRIEFVAKAESAATIRLSARVSVGEQLVATPELLLPDGQDGAFVVGDLPGIPPLSVDVRLQRRDTPTPAEAGSAR